MFLENVHFNHLHFNPSSSVKSDLEIWFWKVCVAVISSNEYDDRQKNMCAHARIE